MSAHFRYLSYVIRHKWFVFLAGLKTDAPLWRLVIHDWSKFLPSEWFPYVEMFHGLGQTIDRVYEREKYAPIKNAFDRAWLHHQHANPHHWQHWVLREDSGATKLLQMPEHFIREMVADWMGAGRAITGRWETAEWYAKNREKILMTEPTRVLVEALLAVQSSILTNVAPKL